MSNFSFLQNEWPGLFQEAVEAEQLTLTRPMPHMHSRRTLEKAVNWLYENDEEPNGPMIPNSLV